MVVRLAGGKNIVVDSKVSLAAYLEAAETSDETVREARLDAHARHLREHVDRLAAKSYWATLSPAPEFVVLFIPGEAFLAPALEHDPALLEHAMARKVHIATPDHPGHDAADRPVRLAAGRRWRRTRGRSSTWAVSSTNASPAWAGTWTGSAARSPPRSPRTTRPSARWRAGCW